MRPHLGAPAADAVLASPGGGAAGGGSGGTSIFPTLPPGTPGYVYVVVAFVVVFAIAAGLVTRYFPARERPAPAPASSPGQAGDDAGGRVNVEVLREVIERLDRDLAKANEAVEAAEAAAERWRADAHHERERGQGLERALQAMREQMARCHDEVTKLRAQMEMLRAPLHRDSLAERPWVRAAPSAAPSRPFPSRDTAREVHDDDPTDPIPGARR